MATIKINLTIPESNSVRRSQIRTGIIATAIHKETGHKYSAIFNSSTSNSSQVNITVPYIGKYIIKYNNPKIYSKSEIEISSTSSTSTINAQYTDLVTYTLCIDEITKECYYLDDAVKIDFTKLNYVPIFQDIKPCTINNSSGTISPLSNFNYIQSNDNNDNIMIQIPKFAYKIYRKNNHLYISITNNKEIALADRQFSYDAFTKEIEGDLDYFYIGAYKGFIDSNNKLRSIVGKQPTANKTLKEFKTAAQANGPRYSITKYSHLKALQCLLLIRYGTFNLLNKLGNGVSNVDDIIDANLSFITGYDVSAINGIPEADLETSTATTYDQGMQYGSISGLCHMRVFGIEDFWGNIFEWIDDFKINQNFIIQSGNTDTYPRIISAISNDSQISNSEDNLGEITRVAGTTEAGFIPIEFDNSYFNDTHSNITIQSTGQYGMFMEGCNLAFGGMWNMGNKVGPFCMAADVDENFQYRSVGARLVYA